ncbi:MAG: CDF family Co(II)/Ni(II) efflux transporter DmeF [Steroidobacteraceae bacterium]
MDIAHPAATRCPTSFLGAHHERNERRTWAVVVITTVMMIAEIAGGAWFGSMALVADGWHMATHAAALSIAALAYRYARAHANDPRFAFGTGKVGELAGFASAVTLGLIALLIGWESVNRLLAPQAIAFDQAIAIAVLGLVVNLVSAAFLHDNGRDPHHDDDDHQHEHEHHHDTNLRAAYLHVLADALTSILAILGLLAGRQLGWNWMDPVAGILSGLVIAKWSIGLMRSAGRSLLDARDTEALRLRIRERLQTTPADEVVDLHLWRLGPGHDALMVSIASDAPATPDVYKARLSGLPGLSHITVEVNRRAT